MERTPLITEFVCVATAGRTADGREISAQHLTEMAESYDPKFYTANLWLEHYRWRNFGQVTELEVREEEGKTKLYARLAPTFEMIERNKQGQGLFTSIEINPNFGDTGKAYLIGLGITDSPASTGTTQLMFSRIGSDNVQLGEAVKLEALPFADEQAESQTHFFRKFFNWLMNGEEAKAEEPKAKIEPTFSVNPDTPKAENNGEDIFSMNKEDFKEVMKEVFTDLLHKQTASAQTVKPETKEEANTVSREEFAALQQQQKELQEKFNALSQTEVTPVPKGAGGVDEQHQAFKIETAM